MEFGILSFHFSLFTKISMIKINSYKCNRGGRGEGAVDAASLLSADLYVVSSQWSVVLDLEFGILDLGFRLTSDV